MRLTALALVLTCLLASGCASAGNTMQGATGSVSRAGQPRPATNPASQTVRTTKGAAEDAPGTATNNASAGARRANYNATETVREALPD